MQQATPPQLAAQALREGRLGDAMVLLKQMPEVPVSIAPRLLMAVAKAPNFEDAMIELQVFAGKIEARALETAILEAIQDKDVCACRQLQALASLMLITKSARTLETLARVHASDIDMLRVLVNEADAPLAKAFAAAVLEACAVLRDVDLAFEVFDKAAESDAAALRAVTEKASKAGGEIKAAKFSQIGTSREASMLAQEIRTRGKNGKLEEALSIFEHAGTDVANTFVHNAILEACIECGDMEKSVYYFSQARSNGFVDVVSYNIMIKGRLAKGDETVARCLLAEIVEKDLVATHASYHGLLNARVNALDQKGAWKLVKEMQAASLT